MEETEELGTEAPAWEASSAKPSVLGGSPVRWAIVALVLVVLCLGYVWWSRQPARHVGDHGEVVGLVAGCGTYVVTDGLTFFGEMRALWWNDLSFGPADGRPVTPAESTLPIDRVYDEVRGRLEVTSARNESSMSATFTADDGTVIAMHGGEQGKTMFPLGCAIPG